MHGDSVLCLWRLGRFRSNSGERETPSACFGDVFTVTLDVDGMQQDRMSAPAKRIKKTGIALALLVVGLFIYSFLVVYHRGDLPEPPNLTKTQKILRGL